MGDAKRALRVEGGGRAALLLLKFGAHAGKRARKGLFTLQTLEALFHHNVWANLKLIEACQGLDDSVLDASVPGTYGTIRDTLIHIVRAEAGYYGRLSGEQPDRSGWGDVPALEQLSAAVRHTGEGLIREALRVQPSDTVHVQWDGETIEISASIIFIQAINHATEHRTHVTTTLTQQGITPPEIDGWTYLSEMKAEGDANV